MNKFKINNHRLVSSAEIMPRRSPERDGGEPSYRVRSFHGRDRDRDRRDRDRDNYYNRDRDRDRDRDTRDRDTSPTPRTFFSRNREKSYNEDRDRERGGGLDYKGERDRDREFRDDDMKISKLARNMCKLESEDIFFHSCSKIEELLQLKDNRKYVARSFNCLCVNFTEVIKGLTNVSWNKKGTNRFCQFLIKIIEVMESQYSRVFKWLLTFIDKKVDSDRRLEISTMVMDIFLQIIPKLNRKQCSTLTCIIHEVIEQIDDPGVFKIHCMIFVAGILNGNEVEDYLFKDFIDLIIGWMVDEGQDEETYNFCFNIIQELDPCFRKDPSFSMILLTQILEDFEDLIFKMEGASLKFLKKVALLAKAFKSVLIIDCIPDKKFLTDSCERLIFDVLDLFEKIPLDSKEANVLKLSLINHTNECISYCRVSGPSATKFIGQQLNVAIENNESLNWSRDFLMEFLFCLSTWIETCISQGQLSEEVLTLFDLVLKFLDSIQNYLSPEDQAVNLGIVHYFLRTRNLVLLQKVYSWLVQKLDYCSETEKSKSIDTEKNLYVLACISDIACNKSNSLLSLWCLSPTIFDLLLSILNQKDNNQLARNAALKLLKSHCNSHSHFVSSMASSKTFLADSPGTRFLPALMKIWLQLIKEETSPWDIWTIEWIFEFLQSSSTYASLLVSTEPTFFTGILKVASNKPRLYKILAELMEWILLDNHYKTEDIILDAVRENFLTILLSSNVKEEWKLRFRKVLQVHPSLIAIEEGNYILSDDLELRIPENEIESEIVSIFDDDDDDNPLINFSQNEFIKCLIDLLSMSIDEKDARLEDGIKNKPLYSKEQISAVVEFLIQSKLKTTIGKPQDFFGKLQLLFKKMNSFKKCLEKDNWKLDFIFELEKKLVLCIYGSAMIEDYLPEGLRSFYLTNKTPCLEWMKRMRIDLIEISLTNKNPGMAYFFACFAGDDEKIKLSLLGLEDLNSLKGLNEMSAFHYLNGNYEKAIEFIKNEESKEDSEEKNSSALDTIVMKNCESIISHELSKWELGMKENPLQLNDLFLNKPGNNLLDLQLKSEFKTNLFMPVKEDSFQIQSLIKIATMIEKNKNFEIEDINQVELLKNEKFMEKDCLNLIETWLSKKLNFDLKNENYNLSELIDFSHHQNAKIYQILFSYLFKKCDFSESAKCYIKLFDLFENPNNDLFLNERLEFYTDFIDKIKTSQVFYDNVILESELLQNLKEKVQVQRFLYKNILKMQLRNSDLWFSYGEFSYNTALSMEENNKDKKIDESESRTFYSSALECFSNYLNLYQEEKKTNKKDFVKNVLFKKCHTLSMIRVLKLQEKGYELDPSEFIISRRWLSLLSEMSKYGKIRDHLLKQFPNDVSFHMAPYYKEEVGKFNGRSGRSVFDSLSYIVSEVNEELFNPSYLQNNNEKSEFEFCPFSKQKSTGTVSKEILVIARELQRIGTSKADLWHSSLQQKIGPDWNKRINSLKKDLARDNNEEKIKIFIKPVIKYLELLWEETKKGDTPSELNFILRNEGYIKQFFKMLNQSEKLENVIRGLEVTKNHFEALSNSTSSKYMLAAISPALSNLNFSEFKISLPGCRPSEFIQSIDPIVICLSTKTKPKKLKFVSNFGKKYEYLVKGNENLNIDTGVMQFLKIAKDFFETPVHTYFVTPLGARGGLIQIVENAIPLFVLYKKYMQRNDILERTSEMFWRRMAEFECNNRSNHAVVRQVFDKLVQETPSELISREILLGSKDPFSWFSSVKSFTRDCAIGSAIGHILGLGDRHLDNILVKTDSGQLVHVDFSIIFGKGETLKIPEKVPFRLTQNIENALQYPGSTNGAYSTYLENYLQIIQESKDIFLFALENIAIFNQLEEDPIINFIPVFQEELRCALSLLKLRFHNSMKSFYNVKKDILECSSDYQSFCDSSYGKTDQMKGCQTNIEQLTLALSLLKEKESNLEELKRLRRHIESNKKEEDVDKIIVKLLEKIGKVEEEFHEAATLLPGLKMFEEMDEYPNLAKRLEKTKIFNLDYSQLIDEMLSNMQEAMKISKLTLQIGWLGERFSFESHSLNEILTNLRNKNYKSLSIENQSVGSFAVILSTLTKGAEKESKQLGKLKEIVILQNINDLTNEILKLEELVASIEETLSRYTNAGKSDFQLFLAYAIPYLKDGIKANQLNFDFISKILFLCKETTSKITDPLPNMNEIFLTFHIKTRNLLQKVMLGQVGELNEAGQMLINEVFCYLNCLSDANTQIVSIEELNINWNLALENVLSNANKFKNFQKDIEENWSGDTDILTFILSPITNFTLPLTKACNTSLINAAQLLVSKHQIFSTNKPNQRDPMFGNLSELDSSFKKLRFYKDLAKGITGCEASLNFYSSEKERFEWSFMNYLSNNENILQKRSTLLKQLKQGLRILQGINSKLDMHVKKLPDEPNGNIKLALNYFYNLKKVAQGIFLFESVRFSTSVIQEYNEICKKLEDNFSKSNLSEVEKFLINFNFESLSTYASCAANDDFQWAQLIGKQISNQLQTEVKHKFTMVESAAKLTKAENTSITKLTKKLNRWKRILANLDTLIQFITNNSMHNTEIEHFTEMVQYDWNPNVIQFWSLMKMDQLISLRSLYSKKFEITENVLQRIVNFVCENCEHFEVNPDNLRETGKQIIDKTKLNSLVNSLNEKISEFNSSTSVESLIRDANNPESLSQMFEGWTPWV